ncbi:hypothetical protein [Lacticaseibacillus saniviri]
MDAARKIRRQLLLAKVQEIENRHGSVSAADVSKEMLDQSFDEFRSETKPIDSKPKRRITKPSRLKIVALARRGLTAKQISEQFGIDYGVVWRQMKKAGLDASKPFIYRDNHGCYFKSVEDVKSFYKVPVSTVIKNHITGITLERGQWSAGRID